MRCFIILLYVTFLVPIKLHSLSIRHNKQALKEIEEDDKNVDDYNQLYWENANSNIEKAYSFAIKGLLLSQKIEDKQGEIGMIICLSNYYRITNNILDAVKYSEKALELSRAIEEKQVLKQLVFLELGFSNINLNPQKSFLCFQKVKKNSSNVWVRAKTDYAIGTLHHKLGNNEEAKKSFYSSISKFDEVNNKESINYPLYSLSTIFINEHSFDSANIYMERMKVNALMNNDIYDQIRLLLLEWKISTLKQEYRNSLAMMDSLELMNENNNLPKNLFEDIQFAKIITFMHLNKLEESLNIINSLSQKAKQNGDKELLIRSYEYLSKIYSDLKMYEKAIVVDKDAFIILRDSINNIQKQQMDEIGLIYDYMAERDSLKFQKEREKLLFNNRINQINAKQRNNNILTISMMLLMSLTVWFYLDKRKSNLKLKKTNEDLEKVNREKEIMYNALELKVKERTLALQKRNNKLEEYASFNSHTLRAPVVRLLGLVTLLKTTDLNSKEIPLILNYLYASSEELDNITYKMQNILEISDVLPNDYNV